MVFVNNSRIRRLARKRRGQPYEIQELDDELDVMPDPTPDCIGSKCMAVRKCTDKCRLIEARACERLGTLDTDNMELDDDC